MVLNTENVHNVFMKCLYEDFEDSSNHVEVEGLTMTVGFNPARLKENECDINKLIDQIRVEDENGLLLFVHMCVNKQKELWTSFHREMEKLMLLGIGIKRMSYMFPREQWAKSYGVPVLHVKGDSEND